MMVASHRLAYLIGLGLSLTDPSNNILLDDVDTYQSKLGQLAHQAL